MKPQLTENQWLSAESPLDIVFHLVTQKHYRKWRLYGAACSRRAILLAPDERLDGLADAAELFADSLINWDQVKAVRKLLAAVRKELGKEFGPDEAKHKAIDALDGATRQKPYDALNSDRKAAYAYAATRRPNYDAGLKAEERIQVALAHDIFGNPFRPVTFDTNWRTSTAVALAKQMYDSRDFGAMPILADALQDAGCEVDDILNHCRDANGVHVRGCWVVDLVLGKN